MAILSSLLDGDGEDEDRTLSILNPHPTLIEGPSLLHELIAGPEQEGQALDYLDSQDTRISLSYHDLHSRAVDLAQRLLPFLGDRSDDQPQIVPVFMPQCPSLYISQLAILKAGASFCPLNLDVPEDRLKFILQDVGAKVVLTTTELSRKLSSLQTLPLLVVDEADDTYSVVSSLQSVHRPTSRDPAYIMYTSGSTGLPKAVCISHGAVTQALLAHDRFIPSFSRFLQFANSTFDVSVFEIFFPLFRGSTLVACDRTRLLKDLPGTMTLLDVDAAELTPSVAASLVRSRENVPGLKLLLTIGEMLNVQVVQEFGGSEDRPSILYGMYGPTEAAIHCTLQPNFGTNEAVNTIGVPLDTVSSFVVKPADPESPMDDLVILPRGEIGELAVGGHQLADGYLNRDEQTSIAFRMHPRYGRVYRTGDKARLLKNGVLECLGRISSGQVKLRGQRIELGEVEHAASKARGCHAVLASVISGMLVAFCIVDSQRVTSDDIRNACRKWLPQFMVPNDIVILEDFPYLPSGKIDRKQLEKDYEDGNASPVLDEESVSSHLQKLLDVLESVLCTRLRPDANLGASGLDSLKAIRLANEFHKQGYPQISALQLLQIGSARDLEAQMGHTSSSYEESDQNRSTLQAALRTVESTALKETVLAKKTDLIEEIFPCTPLQDAMLAETARNHKAYCNNIRLKLRGGPSLSDVRDGFKLLSQRHHSLRSGFCLAPNDISNNVQVVWNDPATSQVSEVTEFDSDFTIQCVDDLLHPLKIQYRSQEDTELSIQLHHALYDQWSIDVLMDDLSAAISQRSIPTRPSFRFVSEYFSRLKLCPDDRESTKEFWQDYLSGANATPIPNLTGKNLPQVDLAVASQMIDMDIPSFQRTAHRMGCSPHVLFQAAYAYLLSVYTGMDDVMFGTVFSGRTAPIDGIADIFGPILSTLPSRLDVSEARKFADIVRILHSSNRDIMQNATLSLSDINRTCGFSGGEAMFDSIFVWQETARTAEEYNSIELVHSRDYLEFALTLELEPMQDGIFAKATFQPSTLPARQIDMLLKAIGQIVNFVIEQPRCLMEDLQVMLSPGLLSITNPLPESFDHQGGLSNYVEQQAVACPDAPAVIFASGFGRFPTPESRLTYKGLNERANRLAHHLLSLGAQPNELVCIFMDKSLDLYVSILATVKTGAAYLPLVPETPIERMRTILAEAKVKICLTDRSAYGTAAALELCSIVDVSNLGLRGVQTTNPSIPYCPSNLAYAVFTSGTTGQPKGVLVTNDNLIGNLEALKEIYPSTTDSRLLQACNQSFDVSVFEIFFAWSAGMCLCSATKDILFEDFENAIRALHITHLSLTPTVAALVNPVNVPNVQFLVTAGEAVTHHVHQSWAGKGLFQGYGPSETTNICTVNPAAVQDDAINNIGPVLKNTSGFVLSPSSDFRPVLAGGLGELCFGGQQVFRGYQNMLDLTRSKIIDHPKYGRIYRSGDLGRLLSNGKIIIEGRIDDQRKIRGQRIELGEVVNCILRSNIAHDCSVQIFGQTKDQERLVAFWIPKADRSQEYRVLEATDELKTSLKKIYNHLTEHLPTYMTPSVLIPITRLPMTAQSKIDSRQLSSDFARMSAQALDAFSISGGETDTSEMSKEENQIALGLAATMKIPISSIRRNISFFSLGLDSVSAIRFSSYIKQQTGLRTDVSTILRHCTIARLTANLSSQNSDEPNETKSTKPGLTDDFLAEDQTKEILEAFKVRGKVIRGILPCTPLQEAMLSASADDRGSAYNSCTTMKLNGSVERIESAWKTMMERHQILRTAFCSTDDPRYPFVQVVLEQVKLPWFECDDEELDTIANVPAPVDSFESPYQLVLNRSAATVKLAINMHHALYDANAMANLFKEVETLYCGSELARPISFSAFLNHVFSANSDQADAFFDKHLKTFKPSSFPKVSRETGYQTVSTQLPFNRDEIDSFLTKHSVSLLSLCQATWAKVLSLAQSSTDICFGNVVSGRSLPVDGIESLVAPCFNTLPVRLNLSKGHNNLALTKMLQRTNVEMMPYQMTSLRRIQQRTTSGKRLFDSLVLLQQPSRSLNNDIWTLEQETGEMNFPCIVEVTPKENDLELSVHLEKSLFDSDASAPAICDAFLASFASCVRYPLSDSLDFIDFEQDLVAGLLASKEQNGEVSVNPSSDHVSEDKWSIAEREIRDAFSSYSKIASDQIHKTTSIYKMGLDSINAIQIATRLRKRGFDISAGDIMEHPSCSQLASAVQSRVQTPHSATPAFDFEAFDSAHRPGVVEAFGISPCAIGAVRPCTPVQAGMLSQFLHANGEQYFNHIFYELDPKCDIEDLRTAWLQVANAHEMLRSGFVQLDDPKHPFAMVTHVTNSMNISNYELKHTEDGGQDFLDLQRSATKDVITQLHLPTWRFSVVTIKSMRCMQLSIHHALYDAETLRSILRNFSAALKGTEFERPGTVDGALSYILKVNETVSDDRKSFWINYLEGMTINRFPNLTPVIAEHENRTVEMACKASRADLEQRCRAKAITMQAASQAAWARLLSAYTGDSLVTFGVVLSGRLSAETAQAAIPCINTLPAFCNTEEDTADLLQGLMSFNANTQKNPFVPLTQIQSYCGHPNEPLFDTLFAYQKLTNGDDDNIPWKTIHEQATVDYGVSIEVEDLSDDLITFRLTFDAAVIPVAQARIMLQQFESLLLQTTSFSCVQDGGIDSMHQLSILKPKEDVLPSDIRLMHEFVEESARKYPDRVALEFVTAVEGSKVTSQSWTYRQLDREGNRVAHLLQKRGAKPGDIVALSLDKCPEASFAFLGILKAGCAFLAIDPSAPVARKSFILGDSKAAALLTTSEIASSLSDTESTEVIDITTESRKGLPDTPVRGVQCEPKMNSYVLYTSGTTGTPKGCELTHDNVVQLLLAFQRLFDGRWTEKSKWLQFASYHFDVAVVEHFWSWSVGICVVVAPRDTILEDLSGFIDTLNISHLDLTPSLGRLLDPKLVPSLHSGVFITGGEAVKQQMIEDWGNTGCLFNFYGPTECTIGVTTFPSVPTNGKASNIGWLFDNVGAYVLRPGTSEPVLRGGVGELCISGKLVGKGYLNKPELTESCFPTLANLQDRVYRTGDLVRLLHNNSFEFLGRADNQVKLRGQRLEIDEIDVVIRECEDVKDTVCVVVKHPEQQKDLLVSFVSKSSDRMQGKPILSSAEQSGPLIEQARSVCEQRLSGYMIPTHFIPIEALPLSINNKLDEKQLKQLYQSMSTNQIQEYAMQSHDQRPLDETERAICRALGATLQLQLGDARPDSNVFALGLSSISAILFSRKLKQEGFTNAQVATVMKYDRISTLAKALSQEGASGTGEVISAKQAIVACRQKYLGLATRLLSCTADDIEAIAPCTPLQQGIIYRSLDHESGLYFNSFRYKLEAVDLDTLRQASQRLLKETPILRTMFLETEDGHVQVVQRSADLHFVTTESWPESVDNTLADCKRKWVAINSSQLRQPFELVVCQGNSETILEVHIHHALYDGISYGLLFDHLVAAYEKTTLANTKVSFIESLPYGPLRQAQGARDFWLDHLAAARFSEMPKLIEEPTTIDTLRSEILQDIDGIDSVRKSLNVTLQALLQASWIVTLSVHHRGPVGIIVSGRSIDLENADSVIGPLFNTVPFSLKFCESDNWQILTKRCHDFNVAALPFQHTPLRDIAKWLKRSPSQPLFETLFVFQQAQPHRPSSKTFIPMEEDNFTADYPLAFEVEEGNDQSLKVTLAAQKHICDSDTARSLIQQFHTNLVRLIKNVEENVGHPLSLVGDSPGQGSLHTHDHSSVNGIHDFEWTEEARIIQNEVASLASSSVTDVDEHVSIFSLGLDSIDAVKLSARLKKKGLGIPVSAIMRVQTIPGMLKHIHNTQKDRSEVHEAHLPRLERDLTAAVRKSGIDMQLIERILPASPMQEALMAEMIKTSYSGYFNHDVLQLRPDLDTGRLQRAWETVIDASPILRTAFVSIDDPDLNFAFAQAVLKPKLLEFDSFSPQEVGSPEECMEQIRAEVARSPVLSCPLRLSLVSGGKTRYLVFSLAHALYDGFSLGLLHEDVRKAYNDQFTPRPSYDATIERALLATGQESERFWSNALSDATKTRVSPLETAIEQTQAHRKEKISSTSADTVSSFCRNQGITAQALCQTAWSLVLSYYSRSLDVMFGLVLAGRDSDEAAQVMFPTMNTVVSRSIVHGSRQEMLRDTQNLIADILQYQQTPLRKIQTSARAKSHGSQSESAQDFNALFDTLFIYQKRPQNSDIKFDDLYVSVGGASDVEYPAAVEAELIDDTLVWRTACKSTHFTADDTEVLLDRLDDVLQELVQRPDHPAFIITSAGLSVCNLPVFEITDVRDESNIDTQQTSGHGQKPSAEPTEIELKIRNVVSKITKIPETNISTTVKLQNLGIDSISAIKLSSLLRAASIKISVSEIMRAGSIAAIAAKMDGQDQPTSSMAGEPARLVSDYVAKKNFRPETFGYNGQDVEKILPATAGQIYMLSTWLSSEGCLFYSDFRYTLEGITDLGRVGQAWKALVARHEILRTVFHTTRGREEPFLQVVLREASAPFYTASSDHNVSGSHQQPFVQLSIEQVNDDMILRLSIHHAMYDAVSLPLLVQDLERLLISGNLARPPPEFSDFIALSIKANSQSERQQFWTDYLSDVESTQRTAPTKTSSRRIDFYDPRALDLDASSEQKLRHHGLSLQALFFAAYARSYAKRTSGQTPSDVVIGLYLANRSHTDDLSSLVAPTVNMVPLRVHRPTQTKIITLAQEVQDDLQRISSAENSAVALSEIEQWTGVRVDTFVNFIKLPDSSDNGGDADQEPGSEEHKAKTSIADKGIRILERDDAGIKTVARKRVYDTNNNNFEPPPELRNSTVQTAYGRSLDVEATVQDGALAIGLFGWEEMVGLEEAQEIVEEVIACLRDVFTKV